MQKVPLANTGEMVSQVCLGAMLMGTRDDWETSVSILDCFMEAGGNFIDTANCYAWWVEGGRGGESETLLGQWMQERRNRDQIFLATKVGAEIKNLGRIKDAQGNIAWDLVPEEYEYLSPATIRAGIEASLRRLQTDYIDLYYCHIDDRRTPIEDTLETLNRLVEEGKTRYIGCSNFRVWRLERSRAISQARGWASYIAIQQEYSYLRPKFHVNFGVGNHVDGELMDYLKSNPDVALIGYSPLLKGIYDDPVKRQRYYNWPHYDTPDSKARLETLSSMAHALGVSNSQLVIAWILHHQQPRVIPIVAASSLAQFQHNMGALAIELTPEQMQTLDQASA
ncbi:MAG: aldo/keto reductase [Chloroflexi bacterium]|nr:aldo/keto reductase [Chloroflexota bacterium]